MCFRPLPDWASTPQVEDLRYVEYERDDGHHQHEDNEDGLLCWPRHVALHGKWTRGSGADHSWVHDEPIEIILPNNERYLQEDSEENRGHVVSQQVAFNFDVAFVVGVLWNFDNSGLGVGQRLFSHLIFFVDNVEDVAEVDQRWSWHKDNLEDPESNVWDWEGLVIADVLATRLFGVANHIWLLITPHL